MATATAASAQKSYARTMDGVRLMRRFRSAQSDKSNFEASCDQIEKFIAPYTGGRLPNNDSESSIEWRRLQVWDFTAIDGSAKLAANIHGTVTSPAIRWYRMSLRDKGLLEDTDAQAYADEVTDRTFDSLQDSDFNTEISSAYLELVAYGNTFVMAETLDELVWEGLDFTSLPLRECFGEEDYRGRLKTFFRRVEWTTLQIVDKFTDGVDLSGIPEVVREAYQNEDGRKKSWEVVFVITERPERMKRWRSYKRKPRTLAKALRPWAAGYFLGDNAEPIGEEGGYYEMPVFHARWDRTPGSMWGHGPGHLALPTVKYLNAWMELVKKAQEKKVDPTTMVSERGLLSDVDHSPGQYVVVRDPQKDMKVLESGGSTDIGENVVAELRAMVRQLFHVDELQLKDSPAMTATEVQVRYELMNRVMGSTLARLQSDLLDPMLQLVIAILTRAGQLPDVPGSVKRATNGDYSLEYQGPLSRAQRTDEVAAIERGASFAAGLMKMGFDEVRDDFDPGQALREAFKRLGMPAKVLRSKTESSRLRKMRMETSAKLAQAETARAQGEAAAQVGAGAQAMQQGGLPVPAQPTPVVSPPMAA